MRIVLVRHPPVAVAPGMCYGSSDVALAAGWEHYCDAARALRERSGNGKDWYFSSPASRCREIAACFSHPGPVDIDERLVEFHFGDWEGVSWDVIPREQIDSWNADIVNAAPPGGESLASMHTRVASWLTELRSRPEAESATVWVFSHAGPIKVMLCHALGLPLAHFTRLAVDFGSHCAIDIEGLDGTRSWPRVDYVNRPLIETAS